ncbi:MAG: CoA transferase [Dehalococcoidia bacterium]|nr:MAG: CoA transferase [Dehalococcoidia bacterium]
MEQPLSDIRVLDLTDDKGLLCGRMLADMGADVIKIEKPGGDPVRNTPPFYHDIPDPEKSLFWFAYSLNKRSITLAIDSEDGKVILRDMVRKADVLVESFPVGYLKKIGLDYAELRKINPNLIMASISPFGQTGPYKKFKASDIVGMAMGGYLYLCGDPEKPPVRISVPQAYLHAASEAAAASMIALCYRDSSGEGQYIDVSMQQSVVMNTFQAIPFWLIDKTVLERAGPFRIGLSAGTRQRQTWPCKNGQINFVIYGAWGATYDILVQWLEENGINTEDLKRLKADNWDVFNMSQERWEKVEKPIGEFFLKHTKEELSEGGMKRGIPLCPVAAPSEVVNSAQLAATGFWMNVEHPELGTSIKYPGFCYKFSETPCKVWRRAPLIGEHNMEIYHDELGLSVKQIISLKEIGVI